MARHVCQSCGHSSPHGSTRLGMPRAPSTSATRHDSPDVLVGALPAGQHGEPPPQDVQRVAVQVGHEVQRRRPPQVVTDLAGQELAQVVRPAHADGGPEHVREAAHAGQRVVGPDGRAGGEDLDVVVLAVRPDGGNELVPDVLEELAQQPFPMADAALPGQERPAVRAVAGVELHPALGQQRTARVDEVEALDLLGVAAGRREDQHRRAERAPPGHRHLALEAARPPRRRQLVAGHRHPEPTDAGRAS